MPKSLLNYIYLKDFVTEIVQPVGNSTDWLYSSQLQEKINTSKISLWLMQIYSQLSPVSLAYLYYC